MDLVSWCHYINFLLAILIVEAKIVSKYILKFRVSNVPLGIAHVLLEYCYVSNSPFFSGELT